MSLKEKSPKAPMSNYERAMQEQQRQEMLLTDKDWHKRAALASDTTVRDRFQPMLARDEDPRVRCALAKNWAIIEPVQDMLVKDDDPNVRLNLGSNSEITPKTRHVLTKDKNPNVANLARKSFVSIEGLDKAAVFAALENASNYPTGIGFLQGGRSGRALTAKRARRMLHNDPTGMFGCGWFVKNLIGDEFDVTWYDKNIETGLAEFVINELRQTGEVNSRNIQLICLEGMLHEAEDAKEIGTNMPAAIVDVLRLPSGTEGYKGRLWRRAEAERETAIRKLKSLKAV